MGTLYARNELTWKEEEIKELAEDILDIVKLDQVSPEIKNMAKRILELLEK
jgi:hypothetical protein